MSSKSDMSIYGENDSLKLSLISISDKPIAFNTLDGFETAQALPVDAAIIGDIAFNKTRLLYPLNRIFNMPGIR